MKRAVKARKGDSDSGNAQPLYVSEDLFKVTGTGIMILKVIQIKLAAGCPKAAGSAATENVVNKGGHA